MFRLPSQSDGPQPLGRHLALGDPLAIPPQELAGNPGRADRPDQPGDGGGPSLEVVLAEVLPVVTVRGRIHGQEVTVALLVVGNHAGTPFGAPSQAAAQSSVCQGW